MSEDFKSQEATGNFPCCQAANYGEHKTNVEDGKCSKEKLAKWLNENLQPAFKNDRGNIRP